MEQKTFEELLLLAEQGDVLAQAELAVRYYKGDKIEQDYEKAIKWFTLSAFVWKREEYNGKDYISCGEEVREWIRYSEDEKGLCKYEFDGKQWCMSERIDSDIEWFSFAGDHGSARMLGDCYLYGYGVEKNINKAIALMEIAAEQGCQGSTLEVANLYAELEDPDYEKVLYWFRKAAEIGFPEARYKIAYCYYEGIGVEKDEVQALKCLRYAMDNFFKFDYYTEDKEWYIKICELAIKLGDEEASDILAELNQ